MAKIQVKPTQETIEKVKKVVAKKVKDTAAVLVDKTKTNVKKAVKAKAAETAAVVKNKALERLHSHATKHLNNWHAKAGVDGAEFAKLLAKHAKSLLK